MEPITLDPIFMPDSNMLMFQTSELNYLAEQRYNDKFGFYQAAFGMYSYMRLTSDFEYKIWYPQGEPHLWQPHNSCAWNPLGVYGFANKTITPCKSKLNLEFCNDEFYNSVFRSFHAWNTGATVGLSAAGQAALTALTNTIVKSATIGNRMMLTAGQLFDPETVAIVTGTPTNVEEAFKKTIGTCRGWIDLLIDLEAGDPTKYAHLNLDSLFIQSGGGQNIATNGQTFTGSVVALYDAIFAAATNDLQEAIIDGGVGDTGRSFMPMFLVSNSVKAKLYADLLALNASAVQIKPRISQRAITANGQTFDVMYIDNVPVIPVADVANYDKLLTGRSHFAYLTISGTIQLGSNFARIPELGSGEVAVAIQQKTDLDELGKVLFLSHSLSATAISDTKYIAGGYKYTVPL